MRKITTFSPLVGLLLLASQPAIAQADYSKVEIKTTDLGHRTYMLEGAGGNITVAVGDNGVIMVDGQFAKLKYDISDTLKRVADMLSLRKDRSSGQATEAPEEMSHGGRALEKLPAPH